MGFRDEQDHLDADFRLLKMVIYRPIGDSKSVLMRFGPSLTPSGVEQ
jgi:hypothetical protein